MVASLFRSSKERPGDDVNFATSTTFNKVKLVDVEDQVSQSESQVVRMR